LLDKAVALGFDAVATGHYAQVVQRPDGRRELHRAADPRKDQSYVLGVLDEDQLSRSFFPLGDTTKPQIREEAEARGFYVASKPDSHDICFIPDGDTRGFSAGLSVSSPVTSSTPRAGSSDPIPAHTDSPSGSDAGSGSTAEVWTASRASSSASRPAQHRRHRHP
jgi:tRNA-specific 2-thiouridylase